jgi:hypothetical protein
VLGSREAHTPTTSVTANGIPSIRIRKNGAERAIFLLANSMTSCGRICAISSSPPSNLAEALRRAQGGDWLPQEIQARREQHRKALAALTAQMERLTEAYLAGVFPWRNIASAVRTSSNGSPPWISNTVWLKLRRANRWRSPGYAKPSLTFVSGFRQD